MTTRPKQSIFNSITRATLGHLPYGGRPKEGTFYFAGFGYETYDGKYDADRRNHIVGAPKKNEKNEKV